MRLELKRATALGITAAAACGLATAGPAAAATKNGNISLAIYPSANFVPGDTSGSSASFGGSYGETGRNISTETQQVRGGGVIASNRSQTRQAISILPGDVFQVVDRADKSKVYVSYTFDGKPSLSDTSCAGQNGFSGTRGNDADITVETVAPYERKINNGGRYGSFTDRGIERRQRGLVRTLGAGTFAGVFQDALALGDIMAATQSLSTNTADTDLTYDVTQYRTVGACPAPPPIVPDTTKPIVAFFELGNLKPTKKQFLANGLSSFFTINEPGTITQDLYLSNGKTPPATATKKAKKKAKKKLVLLGRGSTTSAVAGVVKVTVRASKTGRKELRRHKGAVKVILISSVKDKAGNVTNLPQKKLTLGK